MFSLSAGMLFSSLLSFFVYYYIDYGLNNFPLLTLKKITNFLNFTKKAIFRIVFLASQSFLLVGLSCNIEKYSFHSVIFWLCSYPPYFSKSSFISVTLSLLVLSRLPAVSF